MAQIPQAGEITLSKTKPAAPPFHKHIARSKLLNRTWSVGDAVVIYQITKADRTGKFLVTDKTLVHYE